MDNSTVCVNTPRWVADIGHPATAAVPGLYDLLAPVKRAVAGPDFAGSDEVGGADSDLIVDGLLLDVKATVEPTPTLARSWIYQLLGYVLLDYEDRHGIDRLGIYLARHRRLVTWPLETVLAIATGQERPPTVSALREQLREQLAGKHRR